MLRRHHHKKRMIIHYQEIMIQYGIIILKINNYG